MCRLDTFFAENVLKWTLIKVATPVTKEKQIVVLCLQAYTSQKTGIGQQQVIDLISIFIEAEFVQFGIDDTQR